jgi:hypothetical protein
MEKLLEEVNGVLKRRIRKFDRESFSWLEILRCIGWMVEVYHRRIGDSNVRVSGEERADSVVGEKKEIRWLEGA